MKNIIMWFLNLYVTKRFRDFFWKEFWLCLFGGIYFIWFIITSEKYDNPNIGLHADAWWISWLISIGAVISIIWIISIIGLASGYIYGLITQKKLNSKSQ